MKRQTDWRIVGSKLRYGETELRVDDDRAGKIDETCLNCIQKCNYTVTIVIINFCRCKMVAEKTKVTLIIIRHTETENQ